MPAMPRGGRCSCAVITDSSAAVMGSSTVVFSQPDSVEWLVLRASGIARRRTEEKRAGAFYPLRATTTAADSPRDARAAHKRGGSGDMDDRTGVAVVGSINADLAAFGSPLPRPGETVIGTDFSLVLGGKGANQATAAVRAGAPTYLIGAVGDDFFGGLTLDALAKEGVDVTAVRIVDGLTGIAHIRVDAVSAQNDIMIIPNANHQLSADEVEASLRSLRDHVSVVLVQLEIPLSVVQRVAEVCQDCQLRLVLDPAPAQPLPPQVWPGVFVVKPNELEAEALTGIPVTDHRSAEQAAGWFLDRGVSVAMITRGADGVILVGPDGAAEYPAFPAAPVDTTAAGDAFCGALGASLARGAPLPEALRRSLAAGALAVTVRGASTSLPTAEAVDAFLAAQP
jgi:ribokinase